MLREYTVLTLLDNELRKNVKMSDIRKVRKGFVPPLFDLTVSPIVISP